MAQERAVVKRLREWAMWYSWHRRTLKNSSLEQQNEFLLESMDGCMEIVTMMVEQQIEDSAPKIVVPRGVQLHNSLR